MLMPSKLGYIGSTPSQDTDGDGTPDRQDSEPLKQNAAPSTPPAGSSSGGNNSTTPRRIIQSGGVSNNVSNQVNALPAASNDKDADGWETAHGLNPGDKTDATKDPDHDDLANLGEYRYNTDPHKADDLSAVFGKECKEHGEMTLADWLILGLLLLGATIAFALAARSRHTDSAVVTAKTKKDKTELSE